MWIVDKEDELDYILGVVWATGLFIGEGCVGSCLSKKNNINYEYLDLQISMMDERAMRRFGDLFNVTVMKMFLERRQYFIYKVQVRGKTAEQIIAEMWPYMEGTDKGDQVIRVCKRLGISDWVIGEKVGQIREQCHNIKRGRKTNICGRVRQQFNYMEERTG
jgi:hypothetical protein